MSSRYECKLSPEAMKKAVAELNEPEDNNVRLAAIDELKSRFQKEAKDVELIRSDDAFLVRFLRVRKYDMDRALETLKNYHMKRKEIRNIFDLVDDPKKLEHFASAGSVLPLREGRAKDGTFVIVGRPGRGMVENSDISKFIASIVMSMEKLLENEEIQVYGVTVIQDMSEFGLSFAMQMASNARNFFSIVQEAMPIRVKSLNMVNEGLIFDTIYAIISKFMKEKLKNRLQIHGAEFKTLHEKIDPKYLPFSLGGSGPDLNADWWKKELLSTTGQGEHTSL